jgi:hypothetical protein
LAANGGEVTVDTQAEVTDRLSMTLTSVIE